MLAEPKENNTMENAAFKMAEKLADAGVSPEELRSNRRGLADVARASATAGKIHFFDDLTGSELHEFLVGILHYGPAFISSVADQMTVEA